MNCVLIGHIKEFQFDSWVLLWSPARPVAGMCSCAVETVSFYRWYVITFHFGMTLAPKNYWHFQHVLCICDQFRFWFWGFYLGGISGADLTVSKTRSNNHQTELFMTILIVSVNASVGGTFPVDVVKCWVRSLSFFGHFNNIALFPMTSVGSLKVPLSPLSLCSPLLTFFFFFWNTLTCRIEKNLKWSASGSRADWRGHVFRVAMAMSVYEMTEWLGFSPLCETPRLPQSYK